MKLFKDIKEHKITAITAAVLILIAAACSIGAYHDAHMLPGQYTWLSWKGESENDFSQVSVFIPESRGTGLSDINAFRSKMVKALEDASVVSEDGSQLFTDCYSTSGTATATTGRASNNVPVLAVGGNFFDFHPLKLIDGTYLFDDDLNRNCVVVDGRLAWFLFGGIDVAGLTLNIDGEPFDIVGVVDLEDDFASKKADTSEMMLFMHHDSYALLHTSDDMAALTCYEAVIPNPVKNFALNLVNDNFGIKGVETVEITQRFSLGNIYKALFNMPASVINKGIALPYWENAARYALNVCGLLVGIATFCLILVPVPAIIIALVRHIIEQRNHLKYEVMVDLLEKAEEVVRSRERQRWEKKHPDSND